MIRICHRGWDIYGGGCEFLSVFFRQQLQIKRNVLKRNGGHQPSLSRFASLHHLLHFKLSSQRTRLNACEHSAHFRFRHLTVIMGLEIEPDFGWPLEIAGEA